MRLNEVEFQFFLNLIEQSEKSFVQKKYRDLASTVHANMLFRMGLQDPESMKAGIEAYNKAMSALKIDLLDIYAKYSAGTYDISLAMSRFKEVLGTRYQEIFKAGAMATGNFYYKDIGLTKKDKAFIASARRKEMGFFRKFLVDIKNPSHVPIHPYEKRIEYYQQSAKSMYFNGQVAGFGTDVEIRWVLDFASESCIDCINLSRRVWTWETLPAIPRAGLTSCLMRCRCHLDFRYKGALKRFEIGGMATSASLTAPGRYSRVFDLMGNEIGGEIQKFVEDLSARMNKARQMIEITEGTEKIRWINIRSTLNQQLIDLQKSRKIRTIPSISVMDLESTIKTIAERGGHLIDDFSNIIIGDEVIFVRSNFSAAGIIVFEKNRLVFHSGSGYNIPIDDEIDIIFSLGNKVRNQSLSTIALKFEETSSAVATVQTIKLLLQSGESILPIAVDKANPSIIVSGTERAQAYKELGYKKIPVVRVDRDQFLDDLADYGEEEALRRQGWNG